MNKEFLSYSEVDGLLQTLASKIYVYFEHKKTDLAIYAVPRGGVPVAYGLVKHLLDLGIVARLVADPHYANFIVDDIIDSGQTQESFKNTGRPFFALLRKIPHPTSSEFISADLNLDFQAHFCSSWIVFPWEVSDNPAGETVEGIEANVTRILQYVGEDVRRPGLLETPKRVSKAWNHWCGGYAIKPEEILKVFEDGAETYDQMVTVKNIPFYSHCEHHLAPFFGTATVSYIPDGKIVGLSKLSRLVDAFARRLQVQERLTDQIADALFDNLKPHGVGVVIKARHMCMESRGICQQGHHTITTSLRGALKDDPSVRAEFLEAVNGN